MTGFSLLHSKVWHERILRFLAYIILFGGAIIFVMPFLWMISSSLKAPSQIFRMPIQWIPRPPLFRNYAEAWSAMPFLLFYRNTLFITTMSILGTLFSCSLAAYGFARLNFHGRDLLFTLILGTMMLPGQVTIIPLFIIYKHLGWLNTHLPLFIPSFFGPPFYIFLLRQYFLTIPGELEDAAIIDGCSRVGILRHVFLPLTKPALVAATIFVFMGTWNDFFGPLIYLTSRELFTITLGLAAFRGEFYTEWNLLLAASVTAILPCLIIFFSFQKYFVEGLAMTGMKG